MKRSDSNCWIRRGSGEGPGTMPQADEGVLRWQLCKLLQCVRENDRDTIRRLVADGVPNILNLVDSTAPDGGETALGLAAAENRDDLVQLLLDLGAHPDVVDGGRRTPLMRAAEFGHVQSLEKLIRNNPVPNLNLTDNEGKGVQHAAKSSTLLSTTMHCDKKLIDNSYAIRLFFCS